MRSSIYWLPHTIRTEGYDDRRHIVVFPNNTYDLFSSFSFLEMEKKRSSLNHRKKIIAIIRHLCV